MPVQADHNVALTRYGHFHHTYFDPNTGFRTAANMNVQVSRYGILPYDLRVNAMTLAIGDGMADRFAGPDAMRFIIEGEIWAEQQVSPYLAVPLKPVSPPRGIAEPPWQAVQVPATIPDFPPSDPIHPEYSPEVAVTMQGMKWDFPYEFIQACIYLAISKMLKSEYFEVEPNRSEASMDAEGRAFSFLFGLRRSTVLVGAGRRRNPNPHMPPNIAPVGNFPGTTGWGPGR